MADSKRDLLGNGTLPPLCYSLDNLLKMLHFTTYCSLRNTNGLSPDWLAVSVWTLRSPDIQCVLSAYEMITFIVP